MTSLDLETEWVFHPPPTEYLAKVSFRRFFFTHLKAAKQETKKVSIAISQPVAVQ